MNKVFIPLSTQCTKVREKKKFLSRNWFVPVFEEHRKFLGSYIQYYFLFICFLFMHTFSHMDTTKHSSHDEMMRETENERRTKKIFYRSAASMNSKFLKKVVDYKILSSSSFVVAVITYSMLCKCILTGLSKGVY